MTLNQLMNWNKSSDVPVKKSRQFGRSLMSLHDEIDQMIHDFLGVGQFYPAWKATKETPAIDIIENEKNFQINVDLAGVNPDDIDVSVTDGFLTIKGEKEEQIENKEGSYIYQETQYGFFQRTVSLPETANCDKAEAKFKNGVLKVLISKKEEALQKPRKLEIKKAA